MGTEPPITSEAAELQRLAARYHRNAAQAERLLHIARVSGLAGMLCLGVFLVAFLISAEDARRWVPAGPYFWLVVSAIFLAAHGLLTQQAMRLQDAERQISRMVASWFH